MESLKSTNSEIVQQLTEYRESAKKAQQDLLEVQTDRDYKEAQLSILSSQLENLRASTAKMQHITMDDINSTIENEVIILLTCSIFFSLSFIVVLILLLIILKIH